MARPQKDGLDYFPLDVDIDSDDKFQLLEAKHGLIGFAVIIKLMMKIYNAGYFYTWGEKESLLHSKRVNVDINIVNEIVADAVKWDIFDARLFKKYNILTSNGIQKRFWEVAKRRNQVNIIKSYWLHDVDNILVNDNINLINVDGSTQRKEEESKQEKTISPLEKTINDFIDFRKKIKKPMTDKAVELLLKNLEKLTSDDELKIKILEQSIMNGWQGVFPLKEPQHEKPHDRYEGMII